jgi:hypothetical protein
MGGLEWPALELVAGLLDVRDIESWISDLVLIRDWNNERTR